LSRDDETNCSSFSPQYPGSYIDRCRATPWARGRRKFCAMLTRRFCANKFHPPSGWDDVCACGDEGAEPGSV